MQPTSVSCWGLVEMLLSPRATGCERAESRVRLLPSIFGSPHDTWQMCSAMSAGNRFARKGGEAGLEEVGAFWKEYLDVC